jgi:phosphatidylglycerophosphate synthase
VPAGKDWRASGVFRMDMETLQSPFGALALVHETQIAPVAVPPGEAVSKGEAMLTLRVRHDADLPIAERVLRRSVFKPTDPFLARFNRRLSLPISMKLIRTPVTANQISVSLVALGFWAAWLFARGTYEAGVYAAAISLAASILDGCDGEIARLKYQESAFGCWVETFGDYSYYIAIFIGLTVGAVRSTESPLFIQIGGIALVGALITFALLILLRQRITGERPERLQATAKAHFYATGKRWAWFVAKISVCGTRSTMPYGIMVFALLGWLPAIVVLAAVGANLYWISLAIRLRALLAPVTRTVVVREGES